MSIRSPNKNTDYMKIHDISIIRGDTLSITLRLKIDGEPFTLPENGYVTFAMFESGIKAPIIKYTYDADNQDADKYIDIVVLPYLTADLKPVQSYSYEVEYLINPETIYTMLTGTITVIADKITPSVRGDT